MHPHAKWLPDRRRLHLQHGPSDLIIFVDGEREKAYAAAVARFQTVIKEVMDELDLLQRFITPVSEPPQGAIALRMFEAARHFADFRCVTSMAAVAGAIADEILTTMKQHAELKRAYVNNGGDIAVFLTRGTQFETLIAGADNSRLGRLRIDHRQGAGGLATSGRHGRSLSLGIADSVTTISNSAALADVAATIIGNEIDLKDHPAIIRKPAKAVRDETDLKNIPVVVECGALSVRDVKLALENGRKFAKSLYQKSLISGACLHLRGETMALGGGNYVDLKEYSHV